MSLLTNFFEESPVPHLIMNTIGEFSYDNDRNRLALTVHTKNAGAHACMLLCQGIWTSVSSSGVWRIIISPSSHPILSHLNLDDFPLETPTA